MRWGNVGRIRRSRRAEQRRAEHSVSERRSGGTVNGAVPLGEAADYIIGCREWIWGTFQSYRGRMFGGGYGNR